MIRIDTLNDTALAVTLEGNITRTISRSSRPRLNPCCNGLRPMG